MSFPYRSPDGKTIRLLWSDAIKRSLHACQWTGSKCSQRTLLAPRPFPACGLAVTGKAVVWCVEDIILLY